MGKTPTVMYFWPGLPQLYRKGSWSALVLAVGFAVLVNLALVTTLWWSELISSGLRTGVWVVVVLTWGIALLATRPDHKWKKLSDRKPKEDGFSEAVEHYLKGNWFLAERALQALLRRNPRDVDVGLMLSALLRRTGRLDEAEGRLAELIRLEESRRWSMEIERERNLVRRARQDEGDKTEQSADLQETPQDGDAA